MAENSKSDLHRISDDIPQQRRPGGPGGEGQEIPVAGFANPSHPASPTESCVPIVEPLNQEMGQPGIQPIDVVAPIDVAPIDSAPPRTHESLPSDASEAHDKVDPPNENLIVEVEDPADRSWVFRCVDFFGSAFKYGFGIVSIVLLLAITANIPVLQLISFGYLLEVTGRLARGKRFRDSFVGLSKASRLGSALLGAYLCLLPARLTWVLWYDAMLIDPASAQTSFMRVVHLAVTLAMVAHILAAWFCGGKLRYFFWPLVAPFSFGIWFARKFAGAPAFRKFMDVTVGWLSPHLVNNICNAAPISDFFLPAILWKRLTTGNAYVNARDGLWDFVSGLRLRYYFELGFCGFTGTMIWLFVPTILLFASTELQSATGPNSAPAILCGVLGLLMAVPVFSLLPFLQAHFATDGKFRRFFQPFQVIKNWGRAPILHLIALLVTLLFALPLFLLKIVEIPPETLWGLSIIFIVFSWPARIMVGWAYGRGAAREKSRYWFIRWPALMAAFPLSFIFVFVMFFSRYVTWNGAWSLIENHVFLLPAPYWLG
ncbi:MAG: hypothetical protein AAF456_14470 [Planctomycetota bacterium]